MGGWVGLLSCFCIMYGSSVTLACMNQQGEQETKSLTGAVRRVLTVQFYSEMGQHLRSLKVPGTALTGLAWDRDGLRLAMAVDAHIYLADIRPDHQ